MSILLRTGPNAAQTGSTPNLDDAGRIGQRLILLCVAAGSGHIMVLWITMRRLVDPDGLLQEHGYLRRVLCYCGVIAIASRNASR